MLSFGSGTPTFPQWTWCAPGPLLLYLVSRAVDAAAVRLQHGEGALHAAVLDNHEDIVRLLMYNGAAVNCRNTVRCCSFGFCAAPSSFCEHTHTHTLCTVQSGDTPLLIAADHGNTGMVSLLVETYGASLSECNSVSRDAHTFAPAV